MQWKTIVCWWFALLLTCNLSLAVEMDFGDRLKQRMQEKQREYRAESLSDLGFRYIDTHAHLVSQGPGSQRADYKRSYAGTSDSAVHEMDRVGIGLSLIMPTPQFYQDDNRYDYMDMREPLSRHPGRFALLGGGGTLNPMIHKAYADGVLNEDTKALFTRIAADILAAGAVGFGEMAATHLSHAKEFAKFHPYEWAPADHPLFLILADIAALHDVPIDIHMDLAPEDTPPLPPLRFEPNPEVIPANLTQFEHLLGHNRKARIVWAHAGWDTTGWLNPRFLRGMLARHPNLFLSLKMLPDKGFPKSRVMTDDGKIKPVWMQLLLDFPDRFLIGTDYFHGAEWAENLTPGEGVGRWTHQFLHALPKELAMKIGIENPKQIYKLQN